MQSTAIGVNDFLLLNDTLAVATDAGYFNGTRPSSSVLTVGAYNSNNGSSDALIAYCFHSVEGYSKIGSYEGNSNADGPFIYTGFTPAYILCKNFDNAAQYWNIKDNKRPEYNLESKTLFANATNAEQTDNGVDFVSNGFKFRSSGGGTNTSGTYIYIAFAESPFKTSNAR